MVAFKQIWKSNIGGMTHGIVAIKTDAMSSKIGYYIIKPKSNFYLKDQKTLIFEHKKELLFLNLNA